MKYNKCELTIKVIVGHDQWINQSLNSLTETVKDSLAETFPDCVAQVVGFQLVEEGVEL